VAFSADGRRLAAIRDNTAGAAGALVRIWDVSQADPMPMDLPGTASSGAAVAFSPDGRFLAASGPEDTLDLWRLEPPGAAPVRLPAGQPINGVAFSPDGQRLAAATADGAVRLWDMGILQDPAQAPAAAPTVLVEQPSSTNPTIRSFTWRWSRFNEDFGVVEAPPTETIDP
jgi:WD40 repeat protein